MIDRRKEPVDVATEHVGIPVPIALVLFNGAMGSLAFSVGEGVVDESGVEDRLRDGTQRMMDDPVAERGGRDEPPLRIGHLDLDITAGPVAAVAQFAF